MVSTVLSIKLPLEFATWFGISIRKVFWLESILRPRPHIYVFICLLICSCSSVKCHFNIYNFFVFSFLVCAVSIMKKIISLTCLFLSPNLSTNNTPKISVAMVIKHCTAILVAKIKKGNHFLTVENQHCKKILLWLQLKNFCKLNLSLFHHSMSLFLNVRVSGAHKRLKEADPSDFHKNYGEVYIT